MKQIALCSLHNGYQKLSDCKVVQVNEIGYSATTGEKVVTRRFMYVCTGCLEYSLHYKSKVKKLRTTKESGAYSNQNINKPASQPTPSTTTTPTTTNKLRSIPIGGNNGKTTEA